MTLVVRVRLSKAINSLVDLLHLQHGIGRCSSLWFQPVDSNGAAEAQYETGITCRLCSVLVNGWMHLFPFRIQADSSVCSLLLSAEVFTILWWPDVVVAVARTVVVVAVRIAEAVEVPGESVPV